MNNQEQDDGLDLVFPLDDRPGPAVRISSQRAQALVQAALDTAVPTAQINAPVVPRRGRGTILVLAAAIVVVASAASAGIYAWVQQSDVSGGTNSEPTAQLAPVQQAQQAPDESAQIIEDTPSAAASASAQPEASPTPVPDMSPRPRRPAKSARPAAPARDLLKQANEQRRARNWRAAHRLYQRVRRIYPQSSSAYVATIAAASIRLDHLGDPAGALRLFRTALRQGTDRALAEEARWGIAAACRRLGRRQAEMDALAEFVAKHADSPRTGQARARLRQLEAVGEGSPP